LRHCLDQAAATDAYFSLIYEGENASVMGLGEAAVRDFASHLKNRNQPSDINNRPVDANAVFAYGYSQGGRFLRDFVYRGFTPARTASACSMACWSRRPVQGAVRSIIVRVARRGGNSVMSNLRAVDLYPFADVATPDINGKGWEGLLDRATHDNTVPKIMYIISSSEYWARSASLLQTTTDGKKPVSLAQIVGFIIFPGVPHALRRAGTFTVPGKERLIPTMPMSIWLTA